MKKILFFILCLFGISNPSLGMEVGEPLRKTEKEILKKELKELKKLYIKYNQKNVLCIRGWVISSDKSTLFDFLEGISQWCSIEASDEEIVQYKDLFFLKIKPDYMRPPFDDLARKISYLYGPNCFNAALIACGFFTKEQFRYISGKEFKELIQKNFNEINSNESQMGDVIVFFEEDEPYHAGVKISESIMFAKQGPNEGDTFTFQIIKARNTMKFYRKCDNDQYKNEKLSNFEKQLSDAFVLNQKINFEEFLGLLEKFKSEVNFNESEFLAFNSLQEEAKGNLEKRYKVVVKPGLTATISGRHIILYGDQKTGWFSYQGEVLFIGDKIKVGNDLISKLPLYFKANEPYEIIESL